MSTHDTTKPLADDDFGLVDFVDYDDDDVSADAHGEEAGSAEKSADVIDYANMDDADFDMLVADHSGPSTEYTATHDGTRSTDKYVDELIDLPAESPALPPTELDDNVDGANIGDAGALADDLAEQAESPVLPPTELHDDVDGANINGADTLADDLAEQAESPAPPADDAELALDDSNDQNTPADDIAEPARSPALPAADLDHAAAADDDNDSLGAGPLETAKSPGLPPADLDHDAEDAHVVDHTIYDHPMDDDMLINYEDSDIEAEIEEIRTVSSTNQDEVVDLTDEADIEAIIDAELALPLDIASAHPASNKHVPKTWVYNERDWMVFLGPEQTSYDAEYQHVLFNMSIAQLIHNLHVDTLLKESVEIALEFPSLSLKIDMRDEESFEITLAQLYKCHVAAVEQRQLPSDLANSPYFIPSPDNHYCPLPESFAFIIHTRNSVRSTLEHVMQTLSQHEASAPAAIPLSQDPITVEGSVEPEYVEPDSIEEAETPAASEEEAVDHIHEPVDDDEEVEEAEETESAAEPEHGTTADLLADNLDDGEDEEADVDYEVNEDDAALEDANDDPEGAEETVDELEYADDTAEPELIQDPETHVNSAAASPSSKRTSNDVCADDYAEEPDLDDRAAKKLKRETAADESVETTA